MLWWEEKRAGTSLESSSRFSFPKCFLLVSSSQVHVWCETPFRSPPQIGVLDFHPGLRFSVRSATCVFSSLRPAANWLSKHSQTLLAEGRHICIRWSQTCAEVLGPRVFVVIINYGSTSPVTGGPTISALAWPTPLTNFVFFFFLFSLLL